MKGTVATTSVAIAVSLGLYAADARAQTANDKPIRIAVLSDMTGGFADVAGPGTVMAAKMAVEDYRARYPGRPVEVLSGDHQNKAEIGASMARSWYDTQGVDAILDVPNSAVALAVSEITKNANKTFLVTGGVSSQLTGEKCSTNTIHYSLDTWTMANVPTQSLVNQGGTSWFYISTDYAFGHDMERQSSQALEKAGGKVAGSVRYPLNSLDFSSYLLQAQGSKAKVIALAAPNGDFVNAVKQAAEFGIMGSSQQVTGLAVYISDIISLGADVAKGAIVTTNWYWNLNDGTRDFTKRFGERFNGKVPTELQAGTYSAVYQFLRATDALKQSSDGRAVVAKMKELPSDDPLFGPGTIRADGRKMTPVYVFSVKKPPADQKNDLYQLVRTVPVEEAYRPLADGNCPLVTAAK